MDGELNILKSESPCPRGHLSAGRKIGKASPSKRPYWVLVSVLFCGSLNYILGVTIWVVGSDMFAVVDKLESVLD